MKKMHTLGPSTTDSYRAASYLLENNPKMKETDLVLHHSFEDIYESLDKYNDDYFLVPVAYRSHNRDEDWGSNNYRFWNRLKIVDTFYLPTMPMVLAENTALNNNTIVLHAATAELMRQFERTLNQPLKVEYVTSKPLAFDEFLSGKYQYAIFSQNKFMEHDNYKILKTYQPDMIWCLYHIKATQ